MEITWHGNTCLKIKGQNATILINPDEESGKQKAEIVLSSLKSALPEVEGMEKLLDWPGEYELKDIPVIGFQAWTKSRSEEEEKGAGGDLNTLFYFEIDKFKICHLGNLGHVLTSDVIKEIGDVDILMINAGEGSNLTLKKGMEIVEAIDPRMLIPMGAGGHMDFLKELGVEGVERQTKLVLKSKTDLSDETRQYSVLEKV
jgi:L-ascorbate metabolism protein UlaG (beta-lactamase superfamily)